MRVDRIDRTGEGHGVAAVRTGSEGQAGGIGNRQCSVIDRQRDLYVSAARIDVTDRDRVAVGTLECE